MKIKCAAIRYNGQIYEGASHAKIGIKMVQDGVCPEPYPHGEDQGFVTECGKYVRSEFCRRGLNRFGALLTMRLQRRGFLLGTESVLSKCL